MIFWTEWCKLFQRKRKLAILEELIHV